MFLLWLSYKQHLNHLRPLGNKDNDNYWILTVSFIIIPILQEKKLRHGA